MLCSVRIIVASMALVVLLGSQGPEFIWTHGGQTIGRLKAPQGYSSETYNYREGIVTKLRYADGSYIILQCGLMYRVPLFQDQENRLISSIDLAKKTIRIGKYVTSRLRWREDDYKPRKPVGEGVSLLTPIAPNIGYANVRPEKRDEFDKALDSFVREVEHQPKH